MGMGMTVEETGIKTERKEKKNNNKCNNN